MSGCVESLPRHPGAPSCSYRRTASRRPSETSTSPSAWAASTCRRTRSVPCILRGHSWLHHRNTTCSAASIQANSMCVPRRRRSWNVKDHPTTPSTELRSRHHSIEETGCSGLPCPGSDRWVDITRNDAVERIRKKIGTTRDATWITNESATPTFRSVEGALGRIMALHNFSAKAGGREL